MTRMGQSLKRICQTTKSASKTWVGKLQGEYYEDRARSVGGKVMRTVKTRGVRWYWGLPSVCDIAGGSADSEAPIQKSTI